MPKPFKLREQEEITERLIREGRKLFSRYGLKKTSIEELSTAAGISKASFYAFFTSKEELYLEIIRRAEEEIRDRSEIEEILKSEPPAQALKKIFSVHIKMVRETPILKQIFDREEYAYLFRKLPKNMFEELISADERYMEYLIGFWKEQGHDIKIDPELLAGLLKVISFSLLHQKELGSQADRVIDSLLDLIGMALEKTGKEEQR